MAEILQIGYGFIGARLAPLLVQAGHRLTILQRRAELIVQGARLIRGDCTDRDSLAVALKNCPHPDLILFTAAPDKGDERNYANLYVGGPTNLSRLLTSEASPRWLFVSSTSVYGESQGEWVDEDTPARPQGFRGEIMLAAERQVQALHQQNCIIRFSGVYGPGRNRMLTTVRDGLRIQVEPPSYSNRIHADDCAALLATLTAKMMNNEPLYPLYLGSDDDPAPLAEVCRWIAEQMNRLDTAHPVAQPPGIVGKTANKRCRNTRVHELGFTFRYPDFRAGYAPMIEQLVKNSPQ